MLGAWNLAPGRCETGRLAWGFGKHFTGPARLGLSQRAPAPCLFCLILALARSWNGSLSFLFMIFSSQRQRPCWSVFPRYLQSNHRPVHGVTYRFNCRYRGWMGAAYFH